MNDFMVDYKKGEESMKELKDPMKYVENIESVPNIAQIIRKCGVEVHNADFAKASSTHGVIALYIIENKYNEISKSFHMYIQEGMTLSFQRFLTAYLFCHMRLYGDLEPTKILWPETIYDEKAYCEAIDLLIPDHLLERDLEQAWDVELLSQKYSVSQQVVIAKKDRLKKDKVKKL